MARKRKGTGIIGLLLIVGLLWYTGAGAWLWQRVEHLGAGCYGLAGQSGMSMLKPVCSGLERGVAAIDGATNGIGQRLAELKSRLGGSGSAIQSLSGVGEALQQRLGGLGSGSGELSRLMSEGPQGVSRSADQFRRALDSFSIGQQYLDSGSAAQAVPWLQQGAAQPSGYGMMSQLSLGNLFAQGGSGLSANPTQALAYYTQAKQSLAMLNGSNTPQAQAILQSLPLSPQQLSTQLNAAIASLTGTH